jgi:hypothetical protein
VMLAEENAHRRPEWYANSIGELLGPLLSPPCSPRCSPKLDVRPAEPAPAWRGRGPRYSFPERASPAEPEHALDRRAEGASVSLSLSVSRRGHSRHTARGETESQPACALRSVSVSIMLRREWTGPCVARGAGRSVDAPQPFVM